MERFCDFDVVELVRQFVDIVVVYDSFYCWGLELDRCICMDFFLFWFLFFIDIYFVWFLVF